MHRASRALPASCGQPRVLETHGDIISVHMARPSTTLLPRILFAAALPIRTTHAYSVPISIVAARRGSERSRSEPFRALCSAASSPAAPHANTFDSLGLAPELVDALSAQGIVEPTEVQRAAFQAVLSDGDSVLLSETGSGKTLAYALPLVHRLLRRLDEVDGREDEADGESADDIQVDSWSPATHRARPDQALVLVPNKDLCLQVLGVFEGLLALLPEEKQSRLSVSSLVAERSADRDATILIATPAVALKLWRGPETIRWVIMDEADALLAGSFKPAARATYPIEILVAAVKRSAKLEAQERGERANAAAGPRGAHGARGRAARAQAYASKQFVLTGATMPNAGTKNAEEHVRRLFPLATWFRASRVHQSRAEASHYFVKVDESSRGRALQQALRHGPEGQALVFANTMSYAELAMEETVREVGEGECAFFHAGVHPDERAEILAAYARGELKVLVCTGLASRGIDFANVGHVVQFEVATNAVEFMHRVGRTARAGRAGVSTTLYTTDRAELVEGLRDALAAGQPIEHLFSRKRSFKLKLKKALRREEEARGID